MLFIARNQVFQYSKDLLFFVSFVPFVVNFFLNK